MRKTDINKFSSTPGETGSVTVVEGKKDSSLTIKIVSISILRFIISLFIIGLITASLILFSMRMYVLSLSDDNIVLNLSESKIALTSFIYVNDDNGMPQEYQRVFNSENRVWIDFKDIPKQMKDAIISIEDKRFYDHSGVDWVRTLGAVLNLLKGSQSYGGSTLTQQLIKNITDDNEVSLTRKLREIFRAIHMEQRYSKDQILEAYLNIVNFGAGSRGVQAAANIYFNKNIESCSIAECAAIAGITQNPSAYNPLYYPEKNKKRRDIVLREMVEQEKISVDEYKAAQEESDNMTFDVFSDDDDDNSNIVNPVRNWYVEALFRDVVNDLCVKYRIGKSAAENILLTSGLKIYCAMDQKAQSVAENAIKDSSVMPKDTSVELGYVMMGLDGRILATIGCREPKTGNLWYDRANVAKRQPGSTIKPISVYAPAIEIGAYNYSSLVPDEPLKIDMDGSGTIREWPNNWYKGYKGKVTLQWAIEKSANAPAAQVLNSISTHRSYEFLSQKLGFSSLDGNDASSLSALSAGGTHVGVTVREMTAAFQIFGNGGKFFKPYTYFYVTDKDDNIILDNRNSIPIQAISSQSATIMNRLLRQVVVGPEGTGRGANIGGWDVIGKTGTTNDDYDSWFIGVTPYAVSGIWIGYDNPKRIMETSAAVRTWKYIMSKFLEGKSLIDFNFDSGVVEANYCRITGELYTSSCPGSAVGYYANSRMPQSCSVHRGVSKDNAGEINTTSPVPDQETPPQNESQANQEPESGVVDQESNSQSGETGDGIAPRRITRNSNIIHKKPENSSHINTENSVA